MQKHRIEVDVWAWGRGLESWLVDHIVRGRPDGHTGREREANRTEDMTATIRLSGDFICSPASSPGRRRHGAGCDPDEHRAMVNHIERAHRETAIAAVRDHLSYLESRLDLRDRRDGEPDLRKIPG